MPPPSKAGSVTAFAPASVGNVAVGFDLLGHAIEGPGDHVTVRHRRVGEGLLIRLKSGAVPVPLEPAHNTAGRAVLALCEALGRRPDLELEIDKGIPLASGLGGSAASAVAAVVATAALLELDWPIESLYPYALAGEAVASGSAHGDNVAPQLIGGLTLATTDRILPLPVPDGLSVAVVHPECEVFTKAARACLAEPFALETIVEQMRCLALFVDACHRGDIAQIGDALRDVLIEPRRSALIPGFTEVKQAALRAGALGASISGAGPSVFAWSRSLEQAHATGEAMAASFAAIGLASQVHVSPVAARGARVVAVDAA